MKTMIQLLLLSGIYTYLAGSRQQHMVYQNHENQFIQTTQVAEIKTSVPVKTEKTSSPEVKKPQVVKPLVAEKITLEVSARGMGDFKTLHEAVDFMNSGKVHANYTILLDSGIYEEPALKIYRGQNVRIQGMGDHVTVLKPIHYGTSFIEFSVPLFLEHIKLDGKDQMVTAFRNTGNKVSLTLENVFMIHFHEGINCQAPQGSPGGGLFLNRVELAEISGHPIRIEAGQNIPFYLKADNLVVITTKGISRGLLLSGNKVKARINTFCSHKHPGIPGTPYALIDGAKLDLSEEHFAGYNEELLVSNEEATH